MSQKKPVALMAGSGGKIPRAIFPPSTEDCQISWHVRQIDVHGPFGWHSLDRATLLESIHRALSNFETMTWGEIKKAKKQNHTIAVKQLCKVARDRVDALRLGIDEVFSLRVSGAERIIGIRDRQYLKILWWDPDHQVCPAEFKNT